MRQVIEKAPSEKRLRRQARPWKKFLRGGIRVFPGAGELEKGSEKKEKCTTCTVMENKMAGFFFSLRWHTLNTGRRDSSWNAIDTQNNCRPVSNTKPAVISQMILLLYFFSWIIWEYSCDFHHRGISVSDDLPNGLCAMMNFTIWERSSSLVNIISVGIGISARLRSSPSFLKESLNGHSHFLWTSEIYIVG